MAATQGKRPLQGRLWLLWIPQMVMTSLGQGVHSCFTLKQSLSTKTEFSGGTGDQSQPKGLYFDIPKTKWPILYSSNYDIKVYGLQSLVSFHGFDVGKWGKVHTFLKEGNMTEEGSTVEPNEAQHNDLLVVHEEGYLKALETSRYVAGILEFWPVALVPNRLVQSNILAPFRFQTGGTILGAKLAMERGWAINIGGGFHHSRHNQGGGFCVYADITLAIRFLQQQNKALRAMIVDLDAHQGNGHERDFMKDDNVYVMDIYNKDIYPDDKWAKKAINKKVEVSTGISDQEYLDLLKKNLKEALDEFVPDLVVYNAGTDILIGDQLGKMNISAKGVIERDEIVFSQLRQKQPAIPILMVTSGGYQSTNARVIADSILNLKKKALITPPGGTEPHPVSGEKPSEGKPITGSGTPTSEL